MSDLDPSGSNRLERIEATLARIVELLNLLEKHGEDRLADIEQTGAERFDIVEGKIDRLLEAIEE